jgi:hypothetical protein
VRRPVPQIPADTPVGLRRVLEALIEQVGVSSAQRGPALEANPTWQDLIDSGLITVDPNSPLYANGRQFTIDQAKNWLSSALPAWVTDNTDPPAPTGLTVAANTAGVDLFWDDPTSYTNYDRTDIFRATANNLSLATFVGATSGVTYVDNVPPPGSTFFYWIRHVAKNGRTGPFNDVNGTSYTNSPSVANVTHTFFGGDVLLSWAVGASNLTVQYYVIKRGDTTGSFSTATTIGVSNSNVLRAKADWTGTQRIYVAAVDINNVTGTPVTADITISVPAAPGSFTGVVAGENVVLTWGTSSATLALDRYEVRYGASWAAGTKVADVKGTSLSKNVDWTGSRTFWVAAYDVAGNEGFASSVAVNVQVPSTPTPTFIIEGEKARLEWSASTSTLPLKHYEVRYGASFAAGTFLTTVSATSTLIDPAWTGNRTFWVAGVDTDGNIGTAGSVVATVDAPSAPGVSTTISGPNVIVSWTAPVSSLPVAEYEVRHGASFGAGTLIGRVKGTTMTLRVDYSGSRTYWVAAIDTKGNVGASAGASVTITLPAASSLSAEVIDNNVLLRWSAAQGTLPIETFNVYRNNVLIGSDPARFAAIFETESGDYDYKVEPIDSAGNVGTSITTTATVAQPPDFVLFDSAQSTFPGTKTNALVDPDSGGLIANVDTAETFEGHFTSRGWTTPQNQIDAGYPLYLVGKTTGSYEEVVDYGTTIPSTKITMTPTEFFASGTVTITPNLQKSLDNVGYTDLGNVFAAYSTDFRYVKYKMTFAADHDGTGLATDSSELVVIKPLTYKLDVKLRTAQGVVTCNSGDAGGTTVDITAEGFIDVHAITLTPLSTTAKHPTYDFTDVPNPTSFKALLWDASGARTSGDASWTIRGV